MAAALILLACGAIFANLVTSILLVRASMFSPQQKSLQLILIWLVPFIGCLLPLYFIFESRNVGSFKDSPEIDLTDAWALSHNPRPDSDPSTNHHGL